MDLCLIAMWNNISCSFTSISYLINLLLSGYKCLTNNMIYTYFGRWLYTMTQSTICLWKWNGIFIGNPNIRTSTCTNIEWKSSIKVLFNIHGRILSCFVISMFHLRQFLITKEIQFSINVIKIYTAVLLSRI